MTATATSATTTIDVSRLARDMTERVRFLEQFMGITKDDRHAVTESLTVLGPRLPAVLDEFYDHLLRFDDTRRIFTGSAGAVDPQYMALRKEHLTEWLLMAAANDDPGAFAAYLVKIGHAHTGTAGEGRAVPPRYVVGVTSFMQTRFVTALFDALPDDPRRALRYGLAWNKLLMLQLEVFLKVVAPFWPQWDESFERGATTSARMRMPA